MPAGRIAVTHVGGDSYRIAVRGHVLVVDQPLADGGVDAGPTPTELFAASLASCVAFYAGRYLVRHGVDPRDLRVDAQFDMAGDRPARVGAVRLGMVVPAGLESAKYGALLAVASHCTVHNTLKQLPAVDISISGAAQAR
jgi:uncharacterized OsmC-like protein